MALPAACASSMPWSARRPPFCPTPTRRARSAWFRSCSRRLRSSCDGPKRRSAPPNKNRRSVVFDSLILSLALVAAPSPPPSPFPVAPAAPGTIATPSSTRGLVLPLAPAIAPIVHLPEDALPSGDLAGTSGPFVGLSLSDAIGMALARNTDLGVAQSNRRIAGWQIVAAQGAYDVQLMVQPSFGYEKIPSLSPFQSGPNGGPAQQISAGVNGQAQGLKSSGGHFSVGTRAPRTCQ